MQQQIQYPNNVSLVEVGPRDGLQNESQFVPTEIKLQLIQYLIDSGIRKIETTSFVSPKWVPQMADHSQLMQRLAGITTCDFSVLTPNLHGFQNAHDAGCKEVAVFASASESFSLKNINCSIAQSIDRFRPIMELAKKYNIRVRGYVSCVLGCPYEGHVAPAQVRDVAQQLLTLGCYQISLGDTIGKGNPNTTKQLISYVTQQIDRQRLAFHFHDTYGLALSNILVALQMGVATFDASVAGLGGCPYAKGASGNVASEDVVYLLNTLAIKSDIDLDKLIKAGDYISQYLNRQNGSKVAQAMLANNKHFSTKTNKGA